MEIKARAWNNIDKIMVDLQKITPFATELKGLFIPEAGVKEGHLIIELFSTLQDVEGTDLYAGDIVNHLVTSTPKDSFTRKEIVWEGSSFRVRAKGCQATTLDWIHQSCLKKIGTIHDPEFKEGV